MTRYVCTGRLVRDPEARKAKNGTAVTTFRLAVERPIKSEDGNNADYFNFVAFNKTAEIAAQYLRKGSKVLVESAPRNDDYTKQDGTKVYGIEFYVDRIEMLDGRGETRNEAPEEPAFTETDGELPF